MMQGIAENTEIDVNLFKSKLKTFLLILKSSLLAEVSHDEAEMRERRETLSFLSFLPRRERPLLAGNLKRYRTFSFVIFVFGLVFAFFFFLSFLRCVQ